jgi:hypothetical protein
MRVGAGASNRCARPEMHAMHAHRFVETRIHPHTSTYIHTHLQLSKLDTIPKDYLPSQLAQVKQAILAAEKRNIPGYLRKGDSLPGMPLKFTSSLASQCEDACRSKKACKAYTYHPGQSVCYLKSQVRPGLRGQGCTGDQCWFFGVVNGHV